MFVLDSPTPEMYPPFTHNRFNYFLVLLALTIKQKGKSPLHLLIALPQNYFHILHWFFLLFVVCCVLPFLLTVTIYYLLFSIAIKNLPHLFGRTIGILWTFTRLNPAYLYLFLLSWAPICKADKVNSLLFSFNSDQNLGRRHQKDLQNIFGICELSINNFSFKTSRIINNSHLHSQILNVK